MCVVRVPRSREDVRAGAVIRGRGFLPFLSLMRLSVERRKSVVRITKAVGAIAMISEILGAFPASSGSTGSFPCRPTCTGIGPMTPMRARGTTRCNGLAGNWSGRYVAAGLEWIRSWRLRMARPG
jgi:hypothetical protein